MATTFCIRVRGHLDPAWSEWLQGLTIAHDPNGETVLAGPLSDQAALYAVLLKLADLGLPLLSLASAPEPSGSDRTGSEKARRRR